MYRRNITLALIAIVLLVACGKQATTTSLIEAATVTLISLTETATITPSPTPTNTPTSTPTLTPTPIGGKDSFLLAGHSCHGNSAYYTTECKIYTYDTHSHSAKLLLEGYSLVGVSPDGKMIAVQKIETDQADLFIIDLAKPNQIVLLVEGVARWRSIWFPGTEWIGFIAKVDGKKQVFIIHPDGSSLTQVTDSKIGALTLVPRFNNGVFWGEGTENADGGGIIKRFKWTGLDGTERAFFNFRAVSPSGKYVITDSGYSRNCNGCDLELVDMATGDVRELILSKPTPDADSIALVYPLTDDIWIAFQAASRTTNEKYWIYSSDGTMLLDFSALPYDQESTNYEGVVQSYYSASEVLFGHNFSPDGNWLVIKRELLIKATDGEYYQPNGYYLLNVSTFEIQPLLDKIQVDGTRVISFEGFYWIDIP